MPNINKIIKYIVLIFFTFCCTSSCYADEKIKKKDPYEKFNRVAFKFNDGIDKAILKPVATIYKKIIPKPINRGISNIFQNLHTPSYILNDLLQANFHQLPSDSWRLFFNSTLGILGIFDISSKIGIPYKETNFGVTLAKWGYKDSNYLVIPFWGPSTIRDTIGLPVDYLTTIYPYLPTKNQRNIIGAIEIVDHRAQVLRFEDVYETLAIDKYTFIRDAYLQNRKYLIKPHAKPKEPIEKEKIEPTKEKEDIYYLE